MADLTKISLLLFVCLQQSIAVPFTTNTFTYTASGSPPSIKEMNFNGQILQTIPLPSYSVMQGIPRVDSTGKVLSVGMWRRSLDSTTTNYVYTFDGLAQQIEETAIPSTEGSIVMDTAVAGNDLWMILDASILYTTRGATSAVTSNIIAGVPSTIYGSQLVGSRLYVLVAGVLKYMDPIIKTGAVSLTAVTGISELITSFYIHNTNVLYAVNSVTSNAGVLKKYTLNAGQATLAYTGPDATYCYAIDIAGVMHIVIALVDPMVDSFSLRNGVLYGVGPSPKGLTCSDGELNQDETDIDCGGAKCSKCADSKSCSVNGDCTNDYCDAVTKKCRTPNCGDQVQNQDETDVDCGGLNCIGCVIGKVCKVNFDCRSTACNSTGYCVASCVDGIQNQDESDADCGGRICAPCFNGRKCLVYTDCAFTYCNPNNTCSAQSCSDGFKNQDETDVDCGGEVCSALCADTKSCGQNSDCQSKICNSFQKCAVSTCSDDRMNQDESDVDCGGSTCSPCADTLICSKNSDCQSKVCNSNLNCAAPLCSDNTVNQDETDVDCGGSTCNPCSANLTCSKNLDCQSKICSSDLKCAAPICSDGVMNQDETDVDCGGATCSACADTLVCSKNSDCQSKVCNSDLKTCSVPICSDNTMNQDETDIDCGGSTCSPCANDKSCSKPSDCESNTCTNSVCVNPPVSIPIAEPQSTPVEGPIAVPVELTPSSDSPVSASPIDETPSTSTQPSSTPRQIVSVSIGTTSKLSVIGLLVGLITLLL